MFQKHAFRACLAAFVVFGVTGSPGVAQIYSRGCPCGIPVSHTSMQHTLSARQPGYHMPYPGTVPNQVSRGCNPHCSPRAQAAWAHFETKRANIEGRYQMYPTLVGARLGRDKQLMDLKTEYVATTDYNRRRAISLAQSKRPERLPEYQLDETTGRVAWPEPLGRDERFAPFRSQLESLWSSHRQGESLDYTATKEVTSRMTLILRDMLRSNEVDGSTYLAAKRFLKSLDYEMRLQAGLCRETVALACECEIPTLAPGVISPSEDAFVNAGAGLEKSEASTAIESVPKTGDIVAAAMLLCHYLPGIWTPEVSGDTLAGPSLVASTSATVDRSARSHPQ